MMLSLAIKETKKGRTALQKYFLTEWINRKLKRKEWEEYGVSEKKYVISFLPLISKNLIYLKDEAKRLGVSYGVIRKFLVRKR